MGIPDLGARLSGGVGPLRYAVALMNGAPIPDNPSRFDTTVYTQKKTWVGRVGFDTRWQERATLSGGASYLSGEGLHPGDPATKSSLLWSDANQDGFVTLNELQGVNGLAATPSETFSRWAIGGDLQLGLQSPLGWTRLYGEAVMASNLDRGLYFADPISTGFDLREIGWSAAIVQEIFHNGLAGFRVDSYNPNTDFFEPQRGLFIPTDLTILTLSPTIGVQIPRVARLILQYDYVVDYLGRDVLGATVDLPNDQVTLRGQVEF